MDRLNQLAFDFYPTSLAPAKFATEAHSIRQANATDHCQVLILHQSPRK
jgi:hypothetical protein